MTSKVVARTLSGSEPKSNYPIRNYLITRFNDFVSEFQVDNKYICWNLAPFNNDGSGNGRQIKDWMLQPYQEYDYGVEFVLSHYLGFSKEQVLEWVKNKDNRLNIEGFMIAGKFKGRVHKGYTYRQALASLCLNEYFKSGQSPVRHYKFTAYFISCIFTLV